MGIEGEKFSDLEGYICYMIKKAGSGHYASSMSALEIMYPLFYEQGVKPDQFILSKGHAAPALYAILYDLGYIKSIDGFREHGGLPGHPELSVPGVLCSSGSLGMGISKALGLAWANPDKTYHVLVGDGELQEGQISEALGCFDETKTKNLIIHIDANDHQYSGETRISIPWESAISDGYDSVWWHETTWRRDNHYLTKSKKNPVIEAYSAALLEAMRQHPEIVVLDADLEQDFGLTEVREQYPERLIECGISEQHMVSMANGLALAGKIPFTHTFAAFYRRCIDQVYNNCCDGLHIVYVAGLFSEGETNIGKSHAAGYIPEIFDRVGCGCLEFPGFLETVIATKKSIFLELR